MIWKYNPSERNFGAAFIPRVFIERRGLDLARLFRSANRHDYIDAPMPRTARRCLNLRGLFDSAVVLLGIVLIVGYAMLLVWIGLRAPVPALFPPQAAERAVPAWHAPWLPPEHAGHPALGRPGAAF